MPAALRAARVSLDQDGGQVESAVPWWIWTGSVTRLKKFTGETLRQKVGLRAGSPWVRRMAVASAPSWRVQRMKLSAVSELTGA